MWLEFFQRTNYNCYFITSKIVLAYCIEYVQPNLQKIKLSLSSPSALLGPRLAFEFLVKRARIDGPSKVIYTDQFNMGSSTGNQKLNK